MKTRDLGFGQLASLPDWCYGRRWPVSISKRFQSPGAAWILSPYALPERMIIWEVQITTGGVGYAPTAVLVSFADSLPTTAAQFAELEPVLPQAGYDTLVRNTWGCPFVEQHDFRMLKIPVATGGRRLCMQFQGNVDETASGIFTMVISSIPEEVPDWILGSQARYQK